MEIREGLTFDDVLLEPGRSEVTPNQVSTATRLTKTIRLNIPIVSAAMDTVTESALAIALAQAGGLGVLHRNMSPTDQAEQVREVKRYESGMVINPLTIHPDTTLGEVLEITRRRKISGFPVVEPGTGKLVGILTHRDMRFEQDPKLKAREIMTREGLITVPEGIEGQVPYKGPIGQILHQLVGGLRAAMGYVGAPDIPSFKERARFVRITGAGLRESHVHDVMITREAPNYPSQNS